MKFHFCSALLFTVFILAGCHAISPVHIENEPEARSQEEKCYQEFAALKNLDIASYEKYREQMNAIDQSFQIYRSNESLIDQNASEIMLTEVKKMLSLVCVRISNAVYSNMKDRARLLNSL